MASHDPPTPVHISGTSKGEELVTRKGREPGRAVARKNGYRSARDSSGIDPAHRGPVDARMPEMPPP